MVLTKQDFLIKAGFLLTAVAVSSLHWSIALNPDEESLFHLGSLLAFVISVPIIAVIPGALFFGVTALTMDQRTRDHTRACFLMGLYVVALLMVCFNVTRIADIPRPPSAKGGSGIFWYVAYLYAFIGSLPGVDLSRTQQEINHQRNRPQHNAQRPGINHWLQGDLLSFRIIRWLLVGASSLLVLIIMFGVLNDPHFTFFSNGILLAPAFAVILVFGIRWLWKLPVQDIVRRKTGLDFNGPRAEDGRTREKRTRDFSSKSGNAGSGPSADSIHFYHYYRILGIQPGATINEVKAAYKRQMQQYHPDKVVSLGKELRDLAEAKSKEINGAYRIIMDALGAQP